MCRPRKKYGCTALLVLGSFTVFGAQAGLTFDDPQNVELGPEASATHSGIAIGKSARSYGDYSVAIGGTSFRNSGLAGAYAINGGVAIGSGSRSTKAGDVNFGSRKLSGLKDGTKDDEAVTVRQMKAANAHTDNVKQELVKLIAPAQAKAKAAAVAEAAAHSDEGDRRMLELAREYTDQTRSEDLNYYTRNVGAAVLADAADLTQMRGRQAENNAVTRSRQYTDKHIAQVQLQIKTDRKRALGGIASAMAMTALTQPPAGTSTTFGVSMGSYGGQTALASGLAFRTGDLSHLRVNTSWNPSGGVGVAVGYNLAW